MMLKKRTAPETVTCLMSLFLCQCAELQGFVRPLLELLNGLKKGRFDHGKQAQITAHPPSKHAQTPWAEL